MIKFDKNIKIQYPENLNKSITGDLVFKYSEEGIYTILLNDIGKNFDGTGETVIVGVDVKTP